MQLVQLPKNLQGVKTMCNKSESIKNIAVALCKFNGEVSKIDKNAENPHFKNKYASLDNIIDEIRPILTKHGLSIIQMPGGDGEKFTMTTMLLHESGEWIESDPIVMRPVKNDPQGIGSCATYARRYSLAAFLSLNTGDDDDGNEASQPGRYQIAQNAPQNATQSQPRQTTNRTATPPKSNGASVQAQVYKLREDMGWGWPDLTQFAADVLQRQVKYLKSDVKLEEEWMDILSAMKHTQDQLNAVN